MDTRNTDPCTHVIASEIWKQFLLVELFRQAETLLLLPGSSLRLEQTTSIL